MVLLTREEEEHLWEKGVLGDHSPQAFLNTVFYFNFALCSGDEHHMLQYKDYRYKFSRDTMNNRIYCTSKMSQ